MSDPFFSLNANNLQTIGSTNNRIQEMNASMAKPLIASHSPQLPQQHVIPVATGQQGLSDRQKFEKQRQFQLQQKRLQEMSFSRAVTSNSSNSSADHLMANLIQKVETEAKIDKRLNHNHRVVPKSFNPLTIQPSVATGSAFVPNSIQTSNAPYIQVSSSIQNIPQTSGYFNSYYPSYQSSHFNVNHLPNVSINSLNYMPLNVTSVVGYTPQDKSHHYMPTASSSQNIQSTYSSNSVNMTSDPIFSITTTNGIGSGVTHINTEPIPSTVRPASIQKLPKCFEDLFNLPALYIKVWNYVKVDDMSTFCDTNKLYPVLLSVGLPQTTLAQLWSVVNQTIPGQLTRYELNMALALIALIQKGCNKPLQEIYVLDSLPIPTIQLFTQTEDQKTSFPEVLSISSDIQKTFDSESKQIYLNPLQNNEQNFDNLTKDHKSLRTETIDVNEDDFDDFKSADTSSIQKSNIETNNSLPVLNRNDDYVTNEDEFDDFKSADFNNTVQDENNSLSLVNESKPHSLSDALMSNISAFTPNSNSQQKVVIYPVITSSITETNPSTSGTTEKTFNANTDKYSVFREISGSQIANDNEFGDFLSANNNCDAESVDSLQFGHQDACDNDTIESISNQIIQISRQIIRKSFNILVVNHGQQSVIEAMQSDDGHKFALDLFEIYEIVKRLSKSLESNNKLNNSLIKLIEDIDNTWKSINSVFKKASIHIQLKKRNICSNGGQ